MLFSCNENVINEVARYNLDQRKRWSWDTPARCRRSERLAVVQSTRRGCARPVAIRQAQTSDVALSCHCPAIRCPCKALSDAPDSTVDARQHARVTATPRQYKQSRSSWVVVSVQHKRSERQWCTFPQLQLHQKWPRSQTRFWYI